MNFLTTLRVALRALKTNLLRSILTMLGIIIGVGAVIAMIAVGSGAQERVADQIRGLGSNLIIVMSGNLSSGGVRMGGGSGWTLTEDDATALSAEIPGVVAAPMLRGGAQVIFGNLNWSTTVYGTTMEYLDARGWALNGGRGFEAAEMTSASKVALIGETVSKQLFGDANPVGQTIRIKKVPFEVVGLLERKGQSMGGQDQDDLVLVPITTARKRVLGSGNQAKQRAVGSLVLSIADGYDAPAAQQQMTDLLRQRHKLQGTQDDDFTIRNLSEVLQAQEASSKAMSLLLAAIASVSLLVGGIGIMNIMLVSVTERTREIGLRMAVGARPRVILNQFLIEAMVVALIGGLIGIAVGVISSYAIAAIAGWRVALSPLTIVLAVGFAAAVGIFFGYYPARKASRLSPIEALRYE
jgi:putative ABC transport system permease protein